MRNTNINILEQKWYKTLVKIYKQDGADFIIDKILKIKPTKYYEKKLDEKDIFVITYANSIKTKEPSLANVPDFLSKDYPLINNVHYLPFFKWTSDDGFSVSDYEEIDPRYGKWNDLEKIRNYKYMFDFVVNHSSKSNPWFRKFLDKDPEYSDFYIEKDPNFDYSNIIRPRTSPLFHTYEGRELWSTFSEDQVDLNFRSYKLFAKSIELLSMYVEKGMTTVRLDAIGFIWKESGKTGMHHEYTHELIKAMKAIMNHLYGNVTIISEVNVPHDENMTYLGENGDESDQVYNFALPPLMAFTLLSEDASKFKEWMKFFDNLDSNETMFNFLSSHDGMGMRPVESLLNDKEKDIIINKAKSSNALFNYKSLPDGSKTIYEINSTYTDILFKNNGSEEDQKRYLLAHSLLLFLRGTPAFYFNSLTMRRNWVDGVKETKMNRTINRQHFSKEEMNEILKEDHVVTFIEKLNIAMKVRASNNEFDPYIKQEIITGTPKEIISFKRGESVKVFANVSTKDIDIASENITIPALDIVILKDNKEIF
ncbi:MAG: alpha-amylase family glycosyl hydrolase [Mycoplasma sp.]|nr:alpha-amylase family glycosyl hydrolase [Mycoplasma sp.]